MDSLIKAAANVDDASMVKWKDAKTGVNEKIAVPPLFHALGKTIKSGAGTDPLLKVSLEIRMSVTLCSQRVPKHKQVLLAAGAKPDVVHPKTQKTPLHLAIEKNDLAEVKVGQFALCFALLAPIWTFKTFAVSC